MMRLTRHAIALACFAAILLTAPLAADSEARLRALDERVSRFLYQGENVTDWMTHFHELRHGDICATELEDALSDLRRGRYMIDRTAPPARHDELHEQIRSGYQQLLECNDDLDARLLIFKDLQSWANLRGEEGEAMMLTGAGLREYYEHIPGELSEKSHAIAGELHLTLAMYSWVEQKDFETAFEHLNKITPIMHSLEESKGSLGSMLAVFPMGLSAQDMENVENLDRLIEILYGYEIPSRPRRFMNSQLHDRYKSILTEHPDIALPRMTANIEAWEQAWIEEYGTVPALVGLHHSQSGEYLLQEFYDAQLEHRLFVARHRSAQ